MVEIDDNSKNASIITSCSRVNGPAEFTNEPVKAGTDVFHAAKAMEKHVIKIAGENLSTLLKFFRPLCDTSLDVSDINRRINQMMVAKSEDYFSDIAKTFSTLGAEEWRIASETPASMRAFFGID